MTAFPAPLDRRVSVAPMMGWTDRHDRYFLRLISPNVLLYTVMLTTGALIHGKRDLLAYSQEEHPLALQLGGSDPAELAICAKMAAEYGYDEINLNCGCPSERVQKGQFGACLMAHPALVADCFDAMQQATPDIPVTIKTRIGIDDRDDYQFLCDFVGPISDKGCNVFIIHARKAVLGGLSPAQNRTIPPLKYEVAYRLKQDFPQLKIILNGGIKTVENIQDTLKKCDGVMIGREAYQNPWFLTEIEREIFGAPALPERGAIIQSLLPYIDKCLLEGVELKDITRHILGLYNGLPGARQWRRVLSELAYKPAANTDVVRAALRAVGGAA
jgi:tRNA-dihydrouridine synthase A